MICKTCGRDLEPTIKNFHRRPQNRSGFAGSCRACINLQRNSRPARHFYYYEIIHKDEYKKGKIKSKNKDLATKMMKLRFNGCEILKLCTFRYKDNPTVRARRGTIKC